MEKYISGLSAEDMRILYGKGVLADVSDLLGDDLREAIYKGALSCGVIDGQQIGLPPEAYVTTLLVSDGLWPKAMTILLKAEGFHPVGFPTEAGSGNYWNADYFLVVNAQAGHRDLIDAYLASLFSLPRQRESSHPVRNDIIEASISYMDVPQPSWQYTMGGGVYHPLATKPDGSPWTEEYKDILSRAVPRPQNTSYIEEIILEEAAGYLSGIKTAEQVAEIIQNRAQLYLNERQ